MLRIGLTIVYQVLITPTILMVVGLVTTLVALDLQTRLRIHR